MRIWASESVLGCALGGFGDQVWGFARGGPELAGVGAELAARVDEDVLVLNELELV